MNRRQVRSLVLSSKGITNCRENGEQSSQNSWYSIESAIDKGKIMHFNYDDGKERKYESALVPFLCLCTKIYHEKYETKRKRNSMFNLSLENGEIKSKEKILNNNGLSSESSQTKKTNQLTLN